MPSPAGIYVAGLTVGAYIRFRTLNQRGVWVHGRMTVCPQLSRLPAGCMSCSPVDASPAAKSASTRRCRFRTADRPSQVELRREAESREGGARVDPAKDHVEEVVLAVAMLSSAVMLCGMERGRSLPARLIHDGSKAFWDIQSSQRRSGTCTPKLVQRTSTDSTAHSRPIKRRPPELLLPAGTKSPACRPARNQASTVSSRSTFARCASRRTRRASSSRSVTTWPATFA